MGADPSSGNRHQAQAEIQAYYIKPKYFKSAIYQTANLLDQVITTIKTLCTGTANFKFRI